MSEAFSTGRSVAYGTLVTVVFFVILEVVAHFWEYADVEAEMARKVTGAQEPDSYRVFLFGGSTVEGVHVPEYGFAQQLEFWLRRLHPEKRLEIYNFGRAGRNSSYVRRKVETTVGHDPDLMIVLSGHNEFLSRHVEMSTNRLLSHFALTRSVMRKLERWRSAGQDSVSNERYEPYDRSAPLFAAKLDAYASNMRYVAELARAEGVPLLLLTAPANVADWPPVHRRSRAATDAATRWFENARNALADGRLHEVAADIETRTSETAQDSHLAFLTGRLRAVRGDTDGAYRALQQAREWDPLPWRVLSNMNAEVRAIAAQPGVHLVDVDQRFEAFSGGLVGRDLVSDNCHPAPLGSALIVSELLRIMAEAGLFVEEMPPTAEAQALLDLYLGQFDAPTEKRLQVQYLLANALYAMKPPFFNDPTAREFLDAARDLDPRNWQVWANLASVSLFAGDVERGRAELARASELRGERVVATSPGVPFLGAALAFSGIAVSDVEAVAEGAE